MHAYTDLHCYSTFSSGKEEKWGKKVKQKSQPAGTLQMKF